MGKERAQFPVSPPPVGIGRHKFNDLRDGSSDAHGRRPAGSCIRDGERSRDGRAGLQTGGVQCDPQVFMACQRAADPGGHDPGLIGVGPPRPRLGGPAPQFHRHGDLAAGGQVHRDLPAVQVQGNDVGGLSGRFEQPLGTRLPVAAQLDVFPGWVHAGNVQGLAVMFEKHVLGTRGQVVGQ